MNDNTEGERKEIKSDNPLRRLYDTYAAGVAYVSVIDKNGNEGIGSCFHIGDGVFITARHVVEGCIIKEVGTTVHQSKYFENEDTKLYGVVSSEVTYVPQRTSRIKGPFLHPNEDIDVAAILVSDIDAPVLLLGDHLDDWLGQEHILSEAIVMGYPPIPFAKEPLLIVSKCEINAILDKYTGGHPHFILSSMARGGFSGGPAIGKDGIVLGVVTESLISDNQPTELGYLSVMSVEGIYHCISYHRIVPKHIDKQWDGFWNKESKMYSATQSNHIDISIYRGYEQYYFDIYSFRADIIEKAISIIDSEYKNFYSVTWIHEEMIKVEFKEGTIEENLANLIYKSLNSMIEGIGIKQFGENDTSETTS